MPLFLPPRPTLNGLPVLLFAHTSPSPTGQRRLVSVGGFGSRRREPGPGRRERYSFARLALPRCPVEAFVRDLRVRVFSGDRHARHARVDHKSPTFQGASLPDFVFARLLI